MADDTDTQPLNPHGSADPLPKHEQSLAFQALQESINQQRAATEYHSRRHPAEDLLITTARAMLQITHIVGAREAHAELKKALHEFGPEHVPDAYREVEEHQHGDEQPE